MTKKTALFIFLTLFVIFDIFFFAWLMFRPKAPQTNKSSSMMQTSPNQQPIIAETTLSFFPNPFILTSSSASLPINIDTKTNKITAVQLELSFDPKVVTVTDITPGTFFDSPLELAKKIESKNGKIIYALATKPQVPGKSGLGAVATIQITTTLPKGQKTTVVFLPTSLITAEGSTTSVLKNAANLTISY